MDLIAERLELRPAARPPIARLLLTAKRPPDRVARQPRPPRQLLDRHARDEVLAPKLSPLLHPDQPLLLASNATEALRLKLLPDAPPTTRKGSQFNRRKGGQFSPGADERTTDASKGALKSSEGWQAWLRVRRHFHCYSLNNQLLIAMQRAGSHCLLERAGFDFWSSGACRARWYGDQRARVGSMAGYVGLVGLFVTGIDVGAATGLPA